jgi:hypothetical protein
MVFYDVRPLLLLLVYVVQAGGNTIASTTE